MTLGKFVIKVDGINELNREIQIWDPDDQKMYDFEVWRMNDDIILVTKNETEKTVEKITEEGGCHAW